jgi:hypothetical protein
MHYDAQSLQSWIGRDVCDITGDKFGTLQEVFVDDADTPEWLGVATGPLGARSTLVPMVGFRQFGEALQVDVTKKAVKDAPHIRHDEVITAQVESKLFSHYAVQTDVAMTGPSGDLEQDAETRASDQPRLHRWTEPEPATADA